MVVTRRAGEDPNASVQASRAAAASPAADVRKPSPRGPALLLPNMRSLKPTDLRIEVVGNERRLRFAASLANFGAGPLLVLPQGRTKLSARAAPGGAGAASGREQRRRFPAER